MNGVCAEARHLHHLLQHAHVLRMMAEVVIADEAAVGLTAELAVFLLHKSCLKIGL